MRKTGILGGTFDPVHRVHLKIAECAREQFGLDEVWLMPSGDPPHKKERQITPGNERLYMLKLAVENKAGLEASDYELRRNGIIYTADTLQMLREAYPDREWYFILGGDSLLYLDQWYHPETILACARILVAVRGGENPEQLKEKRRMLLALYPQAQIDFIRMEADSLSSSSIRSVLSAGCRTEEDEKLLADALPEAVWQYIQKKGLYAG